MKRIVLHVGTPKAGSTALQEYLRHNEDNLEKEGVGYYKPLYIYDPWGGEANAQFIWAEALKRLGEPKDKNKRDWLRSNDSLNICMLRLNGEKKKNLLEEKENFKKYASEYDTIILSEEVLWHYAVFYSDWWLVIRDYIKECCGNDIVIDVVTYYRRQDRWILSKWKEDMTNEIADSWSFEETLYKYEKIGYLDYYSILQDMEKVFGREHVVVRSAERRSLREGNIIIDFLETLGIPTDSLSDASELAEKNSSISVTAAHAMSFLNRHAVRKLLRSPVWAGYELTNIESRLNHNYKIRNQVQTKEEREELLGRCAEGNRLISERYMHGREIFDNKLDEGIVVRPNLLRDAVYSAIILGKYCPLILREKIKSKKKI